MNFENVLTELWPDWAANLDDRLIRRVRTHLKLHGIELTPFTGPIALDFLRAADAYLKALAAGTEQDPDLAFWLEGASIAAAEAFGGSRSPDDGFLAIRKPSPTNGTLAKQAVGLN
jgi:hypothetical protein